MIKAVIVPVLSAGLEKLKNILIERESAKNKSRGVIIFCEDRLTLAAEKTVCSALGGTFDVSVNTFARFLAAEKGKKDNILSAQGSAMAIRRIIENNKDKLKLFRKVFRVVRRKRGLRHDSFAIRLENFRKRS